MGNFTGFMFLWAIQNGRKIDVPQNLGTKQGLRHDFGAGGANYFEWGTSVASLIFLILCE